MPTQSQPGTPDRSQPSRRRQILLIAGVVAAAELTVSIWDPVPVYITAGALTLILFVASMVLAWRRNRRAPATFLTDPNSDPAHRSFRTPTHLSTPLMGAAVSQMGVLFLAGSLDFFLEGNRDALWGLAGGVMVAALIASMWHALWHGTWIALYPDRLEASKQTGLLVVPWDALTPDQLGRGGQGHVIELSYTDRRQTRTTGRWVNRDEINFEATNAGFVAAAIATYAAQPDRRAAIGTDAELDRLSESPTRATVAEPAPARTTARRVVTGVALAAAGIGLAGVDHWIHYASTMFTIAAGGAFVAAYRGWKAA